MDDYIKQISQLHNKPNIINPNNAYLKKYLDSQVKISENILKHNLTNSNLAKTAQKSEK